MHVPGPIQTIEVKELHLKKASSLRGSHGNTGPEALTAVARTRLQAHGHSDPDVGNK